MNKTKINSGISDLKKNDIVRIKGNRNGQLINCVSGMIWITQKGDGRDRILSTGDSFCTRLNNDVLVQAMDNAMITVSPAKKAEVYCRIPMTLQAEYA